MVLPQIRNWPKWEAPGTLHPSTFLSLGARESGTYTRHGYIFSSLAGCLTKTSENGAVNGAASLLFCLTLPLTSLSLGRVLRARL